jgi:Double zinc ribbon
VSGSARADGDVSTCPTCAASVAHGDAYCGECGGALSWTSDGQDMAVPFCANCGRPLPGSATVCPACGFEALAETTEVAVAESRTVPAASTASGRPLIPGTPIALGDGERVWKRYRVTALPVIEILGIRLTRFAGEGTLFVTDSRLIFFSTFTRRRQRHRSMLIQETQLEHVTGLGAYVARSFNVFAFVVACLVGILGLAALTQGQPGFGLLLLLASGVAIAALLQGLGYAGSVGLGVQSGAMQGTAIGFGGQVGHEREPRGWMRLLLGPFGRIFAFLSGPTNAADLLMAMPGPDAEQVIVELGALIKDLQSKGSLAGSHWDVVESSPRRTLAGRGA